MADLDDFFAKKDKKKSKKPKFLTADELVKTLEDTSKREAALAKSIKLEMTATSGAAATVVPGTEGANVEVAAKEPEVKPAAPTQPPPVEEEWKDFEEEQRKDYTGLKIGQLALDDEDDESLSEGESENGDDDNNSGVSDSKQSGGGPWKKVVPAEEVTQIPVEKPAATGVYVPSHLKNLQLNSRLGKGRNRTAPDITNADYFPTLGAARPEEQRKKKNEPAFEEVRHGGRMQRIKEPTVATSNAATNRFQSLEEDDG